jgi:D-alanyl-D-alanine carboxypeptidase
VTGTSIERQLDERLFRPLRLSATSFPTGAGIDGAHAHGYIGSATLPRFRSLFDATTVVSPSVGWAAGAVVSNAGEVTRFYAALLSGRLLPPRLLAEMKRPSGGAHYGLGLMEAETPCGRAYGYQGVGPGYRTVVYGRPDGSRVALVMVNVDNTYASQGELEAAAEEAFCFG